MIYPKRGRRDVFRSMVLRMALCIPAFSLAAQTPPPEAAVPSEHASAYYNFSMGHLYAELAQSYGNRPDYLTKAIDFYKLALKQDPAAAFLTEELTDLYIQSGQLNKAVTEAEDLLKANPDNIAARRILGRVYTRLIGDPQAGKVDEKMLKLSIEQYSKIAQQDPSDLDSQLLLARLYRLSHDSVEAEKTYKRVLTKEADNEEALTGLASIYSDRGDTKNAVEVLKKASDATPTGRSLAALASMYEQLGDFAAAADAWKRALPLVPDAERVKRPLAQDLLYSDQADEARKLYEEIAQDSPKDAAIQLRLAEIYRAQHDLTKARAALNVAKEVDGANLDVRYDEVNQLDAEGKPDDAVKALKAMLDDTAKAEYTAGERGARDRMLERLGVLYSSAGKYPSAISTFQQIGEEDGELSKRAQVRIVETWRLAKNPAAARKASDEALKKFPKDRAIVMEHASLLAEAGKVEQAVSEVDSLKDGHNDRELLLADAQLYERAKRFNEEQKALDGAEKLSTNKPEVQAVRFMRGAMFEKMKNFEGAEGEFKKVLSDDPNNSGALNYLGYMLADRNLRLEEALKLISHALELEPLNGAYLDSLGWVYFRLNRLELAEDQLRKALTLDRIDADPTVHDHLGDVLNKMGKVKEAIAQWQISLKNFDAAAPADADPEEMAKVSKKLEDARVRVAKQQTSRPAQ